jgi:hypothetical protein
MLQTLAALDLNDSTKVPIKSVNTIAYIRKHPKEVLCRRQCACMLPVIYDASGGENIAEKLIIIEKLG